MSRSDFEGLGLISEGSGMSSKFLKISRFFDVLTLCMIVVAFLIWILFAFIHCKHEFRIRFDIRQGERLYESFRAVNKVDGLPRAPSFIFVWQ